MAELKEAQLTGKSDDTALNALYGWASLHDCPQIKRFTSLRLVLFQVLGEHQEELGMVSRREIPDALGVAVGSTALNATSSSCTFWRPFSSFATPSRRPKHTVASRHYFLWSLQEGSIF